MCANGCGFCRAVWFTLQDFGDGYFEPLSVGIWACRKAAVTAGDRVLVTGAGPIGLVALQVAIAFGDSTVTVAVADISADRLAVARELGATTVLDAGDHAPLDNSADVLLECSGTPSAVDPCGGAPERGFTAESRAKLAV